MEREIRLKVHDFREVKEKLAALGLHKWVMFVLMVVVAAYIYISE